MPQCARHYTILDTDDIMKSRVVVVLKILVPTGSSFPKKKKTKSGMGAGDWARSFLRIPQMKRKLLSFEQRECPMCKDSESQEMNY